MARIPTASRDRVPPEQAAAFDEYVLGKDVTPIAAGGEKKPTAVVSVRMTSSEIARLERIGRESGQTVSQVIRDAIAADQPPN